MSNWKQYQEEVAQFFREVGMCANTDVPVAGARTSHDVDVVVDTTHAGFEIRWLVECKAWNSRVPKEKVLALRAIVQDTGADRGFIMAEKGYQSGALEAALLTNTTLTSLAELRERLSYELSRVTLEKFSDRAESCRDRYWELDKSDRERFGLKPEAPQGGYSGTVVLNAVDAVLSYAMRRGFPLVYDRTYAALSAYGKRDFQPSGQPGEPIVETAADLVGIIDVELGELERRLDAAYANLAQNEEG